MQSQTSEGIPAEFIDHGGNVAEARRRFPNAPEPWIDLSTGISPWPYPVREISSNAWSRLPEPDGIDRLTAAARRAYGAQAARFVVPCPGTDIIIGLLPRVLAERRDVAIVTPTYTMHEKSWLAAGFQMRAVSHLSEIVDGEIGVVVNPNNPDGRVWPTELLAEIANRAARGGGLLIVDEAFADAAPGTSLLNGRALPPNTVVLRSFGKFYGLAGVRLGFLITDHEIGGRVQEIAGAWSVSGPAIEVGSRALDDAAWKQRAIAQLTTASARLRETLVGAGLDVIGGTAHFRLASANDVAALFAHLAGQGILTRPLPHMGAIRFGVPGDDGVFERLRSALASR